MASISSLCPLASTPARPTISPARTCRSRPRTAGRPRSSTTCRSRTSSTGSPGVCSGLSTRSSTSRPTISVARLRSVAPSVGTVSILLPRRRTVTRSAMSSTSLSLCEMKTTDVPAAVSVRSTLNRSCDSCAVSTAVGSSSTSTLAPRNSARRISTRCWAPTPRSSTLASGRIASPYCSAQLPRAPHRLLVVQQRPARGLGPQHQVLGHGHDRDEHEVLVDHADAQPDRLPRGVDRDRLAVEQDLALVRVVEPVEDVHQRRLAGPVLPEQRMDLAALELEVDRVVRDQRAEALRDPAQLEGGCVAGHRRDLLRVGYLTSAGMSVISPSMICCLISSI